MSTLRIMEAAAEKAEEKEAMEEAAAHEKAVEPEKEELSKRVSKPSHLKKSPFVSK